MCGSGMIRSSRTLLWTGCRWKYTAASLWLCWVPTAAVNRPWPSILTPFCCRKAAPCWWKLYDIRQKVGMVFQNPDNQIVATVVEEDVAFALENLGVPTGEMRTRVDDAMKLAGIYEQRNKAPHKLSGGQKQRVAIAGVIAMRPDCLILDESTAMLDPRGRAQVMKTIRNLRDAGISIVSITHYMEEAAQADRILVMSRGRIVMEGTPEQVFSQTKRLHGYHLDVPQATELRDELAAAGLPMPENIITPEECAKAIFDLLK